MRRDPDYEWLEHTADIRILVRGVDEPALHESAALAAAALIAERPVGEPELAVSFAVEGETAAERLVALLRELLFRFDVDGELPVAAGVRLEDGRLDYAGLAVIFDAQRHVGLREIKAVTWHELEVIDGPEGWTGTIVFDV